MNMLINLDIKKIFSFHCIFFCVFSALVIKSVFIKNFVVVNVEIRCFYIMQTVLFDTYIPFMISNTLLVLIQVAYRTKEFATCSQVVLEYNLFCLFANAIGIIISLYRMKRRAANNKNNKY